MFFYLSKVLWAVAQPSSLLLLALLWGVWLLRRERQRASRRWLLAVALAFLVGGLSPLGHLLTLPLENRFPRPHALDDVSDAAGVIVLGGAMDTLVSAGRGGVSLTDAAERLTEPVSLLHRFPAWPLVFSGGDGHLIASGTSEADVARQLYDGLGVSPDRLWLEDRSRNTHQNAIFTADLLRQRGQEKKRWLLVTSAYHMPRAVGCFRAAGLDVIAFPVDYRTSGWDDLLRVFPRPSEGLRRLDEIVREWIGLVVYRLTGRTDALLPGPTF